MGLLETHLHARLDLNHPVFVNRHDDRSKLERRNLLLHELEPALQLGVRDEFLRNERLDGRLRGGLAGNRCCGLSVLHIQIRRQSA